MRMLSTLILSALAGVFPAMATEININYSADFAEKLTDDYGVKSGEMLSEMIEQRIIGVVDEGVLARISAIEIALIDAKPNRPTFAQMSNKIGLSSQSFGIGGMSLAAVVKFTDGSPDVEIKHSWFSSDIREARYRGMWTDAKRSARRFVTKLNKRLQNTSS